MAAVEKGLRGFVHRAADGRAAQQGAALAAAGAAAVTAGGGKAAEQAFDVAGIKQPQIDGVFQVHQRVADVVGSFHQVRQGMTRPAVAALREQAEFGGDAADIGHFGLVDIEFAAGAVAGAAPRVFEQGADRCGSQAQAAAVAVALQAGDLAQAVGVAFVTLHVAAFGIAKAVKKTGVFRLPEPASERVFAGVAEGRIAQIVRQTSHLHGGANIDGLQMLRQLAGSGQHAAGAGAETAADAGNFDAVGQAVVGVVVFRQRMHLGFAAEPAEGVAKYHAVVIDVISAAVVFGGFGRQRAHAVVFGQIKAGGGHQLRPVHRILHGLSLRVGKGWNVGFARRVLSGCLKNKTA